MWDGWDTNIWDGWADSEDDIVVKLTRITSRITSSIVSKIAYFY